MCFRVPDVWYNNCSERVWCQHETVDSDLQHLLSWPGHVRLGSRWTSLHHTRTSHRPSGHMEAL